MTPGLRPAPFRGELSSKRVAAPQTGQCRPTDRSHAWARRDEARESQASWTTSTSSSRSSSPSRLARMRTDKWPSKCVVVNQGECGGANTTGAGGAGMRYLQTSADEGGGLRVIPARRRHTLLRNEPHLRLATTREPGTTTSPRCPTSLPGRRIRLPPRGGGSSIGESATWPNVVGHS